MAGLTWAECMEIHITEILTTVTTMGTMAEATEDIMAVVITATTVGVIMAGETTDGQITIIGTTRLRQQITTAERVEQLQEVVPLPEETLQEP